MLQIILLSAGLMWTAAAANAASREIHYLGMNECRQGGCRVPIFDKGFLIQMKDYIGAPPDGFTAYDPDGREMYQVDITAPDGTPGHLKGAAADSDGTVGVVITYGGYGGHGHVKGGAIMLVDRNGKQRLLAETGRWLPARLCFAPDHSIWTAGTQFAPLRVGDDQDHVEHSDYPVIRKYSSSGTLEGEYLPRSLFPPGLPPGEGGWIRASEDRIGYLAYPGMVADKPEWIELDFDGKLTGRWQLGGEYISDNVTHSLTYRRSTYAFTSGGRLLAESESGSAHYSKELIFFDKATSTWQATNVAQGLLNGSSYLAGADGNDAVFINDTGGVRLLWVSLSH